MNTSLSLTALAIKLGIGEIDWSTATSSAAQSVGDEAADAVYASEEEVRAAALDCGVIDDIDQDLPLRKRVDYCLQIAASGVIEEKAWAWLEEQRKERDAELDRQAGFKLAVCDQITRRSRAAAGMNGSRSSAAMLSSAISSRTTGHQVGRTSAATWLRQSGRRDEPLLADR